MNFQKQNNLSIYEQKTDTAGSLTLIHERCVGKTCQPCASIAATQ